jgi:hypothetical protein
MQQLWPRGCQTSTCPSTASSRVGERVGGWARLPCKHALAGSAGLQCLRSVQALQGMLAEHACSHAARHFPTQGALLGAHQHAPCPFACHFVSRPALPAVGQFRDLVETAERNKGLRETLKQVGGRQGGREGAQE